MVCVPSFPIGSTLKNLETPADKGDRDYKESPSKTLQCKPHTHTQFHKTSVWPVLSTLTSFDKACMVYQSVVKYNDRQAYASLVCQGAREKHTQ